MYLLTTIAELGVCVWADVGEWHCTTALYSKGAVEMCLSAGLQADVVVCGSAWEEISFLVVLEEGGDGTGSYANLPKKAHF